MGVCAISVANRGTVDHFVAFGGPTISRVVGDGFIFTYDIGKGNLGNAEAVAEIFVKCLKSSVPILTVDDTVGGFGVDVVGFPFF